MKTPRKADSNPDVRKSVSLPQDMWSEIEAYGDQERIKTQAEALRRVVQAGLRALRGKSDRG